MQDTQDIFQITDVHIYKWTDTHVCKFVKSSTSILGATDINVAKGQQIWMQNKVYLETVQNIKKLQIYSKQIQMCLKFESL